MLLNAQSELLITYVINKINEFKVILVHNSVSLYIFIRIPGLATVLEWLGLDTSDDLESDTSSTDTSTTNTPPPESSPSKSSDSYEQAVGGGRRVWQFGVLIKKIYNLMDMFVCITIWSNEFMRCYSYY